MKSRQLEFDFDDVEEDETWHRREQSLDYYLTLFRERIKTRKRNRVGAEYERYRK